ncbi:hypothetical protein Dimus_013710 [Dionaea muscipula]
MSVIHLKKKDVVKSSVKGVVIEFDHEKLATILGVPGTNGICEYIKDVWEESKYTKPLEITRRFANDENLMAARRITNYLMEIGSFGVALVEKKGEEPKRYDYFEETFLTMCKLTRENGEAVIDEAAVEGESGSGEKFYDAEDKEQGSPEVNEEIRATVPRVRLGETRKEASGVDPSCPTGRIPEAVTLKFQAEFERKGANRFHAD